ncbi:MAG: sigma 54-interacting transcriptional regulator [Thermodesulfobacteriota bacterium]
MNTNQAPDFTTAQWAFLATLAAFGAPVSVDWVGLISPLAPGALLDLMGRAGRIGLVEKHGPDVFRLASVLPESVKLRLRDLTSPEFLSEMITQMKKNGLIQQVSPEILAGLLERAGRLEEAADLHVASARGALARRGLEEAYQYLHRALTLMVPGLGRPDLDAAYVASALDFAGLAFVLGQDFSEATDFLETAVNLTGTLGDKRSQALIRLHLGRFFYLGDRRLEAVKAFEAGWAAVEELGDEDIRTRSAEFIGLYYFIRGLHLEAIEHLERATQAFETLGDTMLANASAPLYLGYCAAYLGQYHRAVGALDFSWRRAKRDANTILASMYRAALGTVLLFINKTPEALDHLHSALEEAKRGRNALAVYSASGGLAYYHFVNNQTREARKILARLLEEGRSAGIKRQFASPYILEMLFEFHRQGLEPIPGFSFHDQVERLMKEPSVHLRGVALRLRAKEYLLLGDDHQNIHSYLLESEACLIRSGDPIQLAKTRVEMARLKLGEGRREEARLLAQQARKGLSGHSEDLFPDGLRSLLEGLAPKDSAADPPGGYFLFNVEALVQAPLSPSFEETLEKLVIQMNRLLGAERGGIFWVDDLKTHDPRLRVARNLNEDETRLPVFRPARELIRRSFRSARPLISPNQDSAGGPAGPGRAAALCLPIHIHGRIKAVLYHDNTYLPDCFEGLSQAVLDRVAVRLGDFLERSYQFAQIVEEARRVAVERSVQSELAGGEEIVTGSSPATAKAMEMIVRAARSDSTVLIHGETGVGKELLSRRLHELSDRGRKPFITVDPTTIPENLMESELFGYEKGAFTGADRGKPGRVELAHQGTLFIDEISEIPVSAQAKLLRLLQEKTFTRIGGIRPQTSNFRLVAATNRNLEEEVAAGRFRQDLYYRLNIIVLRIPPLRERPEDIVPLARHFLARFAKKYSRPGLFFTADDEAWLKVYPWPGNIRELKNIIERSVLLGTGPVLELNIPSSPARAQTSPFEDNPHLDEVQRRYIRHVLNQTGGRIGGSGGAAEILGMKRTSVHSRMKKLGLPGPGRSNQGR